MIPQDNNTWRDPVMEGNPQDTSYASYMSPLVACLAASHGNVLELGMGFWSTGFLHRYCLASGRMLFSMDSDPKWVSPFMQYEVRGLHEVISCHQNDYDAELDRLSALKWGVVLLDHSPGWRRALDALNLMNNSQYLLVHDYSGDEVKQGFNAQCLAHWAHARVATYSPTTLVLSNSVIPWWPNFEEIS